MRGDSLRDLYAKALALVGLGVLAGVGALVDYWPAQGPVPAIARAPVPPAFPQSIESAAVTHAPVQTRVPRRSLQPPSAGRAQQAAAVDERPSSATAPMVGESGARDSHELAPAAGFAHPVLVPPVTALDEVAVAVAVAATAEIPVDSATLSEPSAVSASASTDLFGEQSVAPFVLAEVTDEGDGLITGAFKRTGSSIVKTGARTGASIFDAVRIVSGMVRRALPAN